MGKIPRIEELSQSGGFLLCGGKGVYEGCPPEEIRDGFMADRWFSYYLSEATVHWNGFD